MGTGAHAITVLGTQEYCIKVQSLRHTRYYMINLLQYTADMHCMYTWL